MPYPTELWPPRPRDPGPYEPQLRRDVAASLAARRELGPEYDDPIAAGLAERVEELAAYRLAELRQQATADELDRRDDHAARRQRLALGIVSVSVGVPITAIAANSVEPGIIGIAVSWAGLVAVNAVHAISQRRRR